MKVRIKAKAASVRSEAEVVNAKGEVLFRTETDPLSSPRRTRVMDAAGNEIAAITTVRLDESKRAHHVVMASGDTYDCVRRFRNPASTTESIITVKGTGWQSLTRRAWTNRFEIRAGAGRVLAVAKQSPAALGDAYDVEVKDETHLAELVIFSLIIRYIMKQDNPVPLT